MTTPPRPRPRAIRPPLIFGALTATLVAALLVGAVVAAHLNTTAALAAATIAGLVVDLVGVAAWTWVAQRCRGLERAAFRCVAAILALWASTRVARLVDLGREGTFSAGLFEQVVWTAVAALGVASMLLLYAHYRERPSWDGPIDAGIVALSTIVLIGMITAGFDGVGARIAPSTTVYLALAGGLLVGLGGMVMWHRSAVRIWLRWALAALALLVVDMAFSVASAPAHEHLRPRLVALAAGVGASACLTLAALYRHEAGDRASAAPALGPRPRAMLMRLLPPLAMIAAIAAVAADHGVLGVLMVAATVLLLMRMLGTVRTVESLLDERSHWAITDPLTGAYNRRHLEHELPALAARARRADEPLTAAVIDLDNFKAVNDTHGHATGDRLLRSVVAAIAREQRASDPLFRVGGDEFMILLPATGRDEAAALVERIRGRLEHIAAEALPDGPNVTASIGVVAVPRNTPSVEAVLERADMALYAAKNGGRNRVIYDDELPPAGSG